MLTYAVDESSCSAQVLLIHYAIFLVYLSLSSTNISTDCWCQLVNIPPVDINFGCSDRMSVCALHKSTNRYVVYTVDFYILYFVA